MSNITISNLRKIYGPIAAVDGLSIEIPASTVFGLLGPNGAGKTTTFKCLLGLARPTFTRPSPNRLSKPGNRRCRTTRATESVQEDPRSGKGTGSLPLERESGPR